MSDYHTFELESAKLGGKITLIYSTSKFADSLIIKAECDDEYRIPSTDYDDMDDHSKQKYKVATEKLDALNEELGTAFTEIKSAYKAGWGFKAVRTYVDISGDPDLDRQLRGLVRSGFISEEQALDVTNSLAMPKVQYLGRITPPEVRGVPKV